MNAISGYDRWDMIKTEIMADAEKIAFVRAISKGELLVVRRADFDCVPSQAGRCHLNVREQVAQYGGKQVYGWHLNTERTNGAELSGRVYAAFHSNWMDEAGMLWDVTDPIEQYHLFLHDPLRVYDFENKISYNNRMVFLSDYVQINAADRVVRNKMLFTANGYLSRDRIFEKYKMPTSLQELQTALPSQYVNEDGKISDEGNMWLSLKYSVGVRK